MKSNKILFFWTGKGQGRYSNYHINVAAYSRKQAGKLISLACGYKVTDSDINNSYSTRWGHNMNNFIIEYPCVFICYKKEGFLPTLILQVKGKEILQLVHDPDKLEHAYKAPFISREEGAKIRANHSTVPEVMNTIDAPKYNRKQCLQFAVSFADHCLKEAGVKAQSIGEMVKYKHNLK